MSQRKRIKNARPFDELFGVFKGYLSLFSVFLHNSGETTRQTK